MKIAVMGAGSMGSIMGALLSKAGMDATLVDANTEHVRVMNEKGLKIAGHLDETIPVRAVTPEEMKGIFNLVIFVIKATANVTAINQLIPHINAGSTVITLQNGINEDEVADVVGKDRTCGGVMLWGATLLGPGVSELTSAPDQMSMTIGEIDGNFTDRIKRVKEVLEKVCKIEVTGELMSHKWGKLYINAAFSGVGTVIGGDYGKVVDDAKAAQTAAFVGMDTVRTAKALGYDRDKFMFMPPDFFLFETEDKLNNILNFYRAALAAHRNIYPSMLQDIEKGRRCEVDVINGYIEKKARESGTNTPVNDKITLMIREIESGKRQPSLSNLHEIELPRLK